MADKIPDLAFCKGIKCLKKKFCYRHMINRDKKYKSYIDFRKICNEENNYVWFVQSKLLGE